MTTSIRITQEYADKLRHPKTRHVEVTVSDDDLNIEEMFGLLCRCLCGFGYSAEDIDEYLNTPEPGRLMKEDGEDA